MNKIQAERELKAEITKFNEKNIKFVLLLLQAAMMWFLYCMGTHPEHQVLLL